MSDLTTHAYNNNALSYRDKVSVLEEYMKQIRNFASALPANGRVLDLGCGPGINSEVFTKAGCDVTGVDSSSEMIRLAQGVCPSGTFHVSPVQTFQPEETFYAVLLSFIIVHLTDGETEDLFSKLPSTLVKGGLLYLSYMTGKKPGMETTSFSSDPIFFNYYYDDRITEMLEGFGFTPVSFSTAPYIEQDGSVTRDVFRIFRFTGSISQTGLQM